MLLVAAVLQATVRRHNICDAIIFFDNGYCQIEFPLQNKQVGAEQTGRRSPGGEVSDRKRKKPHLWGFVVER